MCQFSGQTVRYQSHWISKSYWKLRISRLHVHCTVCVQLALQLHNRHRKRLCLLIYWLKLQKVVWQITTPMTVVAPPTHGHWTCCATVNIYDDDPPPRDLQLWPFDPFEAIIIVTEHTNANKRLRNTRDTTLITFRTHAQSHHQKYSIASLKLKKKYQSSKL